MSSFKLKLLLIDLSTNQKTGIVHKLSKNRFQANYKLTVGVYISTKDVEFGGGENATLSIWNIGEQRRFEFIRKSFYKGAAGAIFIFDLTQEKTYIETRKWLTEIRQFAGPIPFLLIGNNIDLLKLTEIDSMRKEAREFTLNEGGIYIETSSISFYIVEEALSKLIRKIIDLRTLD